jgi:oligoribonuclease NrnB/cAMP/cGMP phosphodiesterase (DHH superfamily)
MNKSSKNIVVIYHASCPDGFGAAWAAWKKFGNRAEYHAMPYTAKPLMPRGKQVYFLDFSYKPDIMRRVVKIAAKVVIVDHHASAKDSVKLAQESLYDMKHSGAVLAWKYFHPGKPMPRLLLHIEDEDLWNFKLPNTMAVNARLELLNFDFKELDKVVRDFEKPALRKKFIEEGNLLGAYRTRLVHRLIEENAVPVKFFGHRIFAVNGARPFTSEIGHALYEMKPPMAIIWQEKPAGITVSLRSNGTVDVSKIAAKFGGGGHKGAAAFYLPRNAKKPWSYLKK